jgi:hypothetical protein
MQKEKYGCRKQQQAHQEKKKKNKQPAGMQ